MFVIATGKDLYCFAVLSEHIIHTVLYLLLRGFLFYWAHVRAGRNISSRSIVSSQRLFTFLVISVPLVNGTILGMPYTHTSVPNVPDSQFLNWQRQQTTRAVGWRQSSGSLINPYKMSLNSFQNIVSAIIWRIHIIFDHYAVTGCSLIISSNFLTWWKCVANVTVISKSIP